MKEVCGNCKHNKRTFDYDSTEFEVVGNIYDNKLEDFNNG